jgi:phenylpyruvate tautomerase PptA (4-oxalocrotonate tautomerase family)
MPVAKVYVPEGALTPDQRRALAKGIHDVISRVEKLPPEGPAGTYVLINEVPSGGWASRGVIYTPRT